MIKKFLAACVIFSASAITIYAQGPDGGNPGGIKLENPFKGPDSLFDLLKAIIQDILIPIGAVLAVIGFIYAGFKYVVARGDTKKIEEAHRTLLYVAVGTAVLLGAWTISQVIQNTISKLM